jgi:hypothetical protein
MGTLKIIGFRHHIVDKETGEQISEIKDYPQILTSAIGQSYMVAVVQLHDPNGILIFGGLPRRLVIFESQNPEIFHALENGERPLLPGNIVKVAVEPYLIGDKVTYTRTVAVIANNKEEEILEINKALTHQKERL